MVEAITETAMDGNAAQLRAITSQLADEVLTRLEDKKVSPHHDPEFQEWIDKRISEKFKVWLGGIVLAYAIPTLAVAYAIGSFQTTLETGLEKIDKQQATLDERGEWMHDKDSFQRDITRWAERVPNHPYEE